VAAGLALLLGGFGRAMTIQSARTAAERDRAAQVSSFVTDLLRSPDPYRGRSADVTVRQVLDSAVVRIRSELRGQPVLQADLLAVIGRSYRGLGLLPEAQSALDSAIALRLRAGDEGGALAEDEAVLSSVVFDAGGDRRLGDSLARVAVRTGRRVLGRDDTALATVLTLTSSHLAESGSETEGESLLVDAIGILGRAPRPDSLAIADALRMLGERRWAVADFAGAETLYVKALRLGRARLGPDHPDIGRLSAGLGEVLAREGKPDALRYLRAGVDIQRRVLGPDHHDVVKSEIFLADQLVKQGQLDTAESLFHKAVAWASRFSPQGHEYTAEGVFGLGEVALQRGDSANAETLFQQSIDSFELVLRPQERYAYGGIRGQLARLRMARRDYAGAESLLVAAREAARLQWGEGSARAQYFDADLVGLYAAWGKPELVQRYCRYIQPGTPGTAQARASCDAAESARRF
jgi:serine/threonine-protein kinase